MELFPHAHAPRETPERDAAFEVLSRLRRAPQNFTVYFAGGCVRDELLGRTPDDYDIVTTATPAEIERIFGGKYSSHVGAHFGVMVVRARGEMIEVATFRRDGDYQDGRRPVSVQFSDPAQDARRRDFTVNALFLDPLATGEAAGPGGVVIDYVGGMADLQSRTLRAVGDPERRLAEDHLRALRGPRFAAKLGFIIHEATAQAIRLHAGDLAGVSRERVGDELRRMLAHPTRVAAAEHLQSLQLLGPALLLEPGCASGSDWAHLRALPPQAGADTSLAEIWCAMALDLGTLPDANGAGELTPRLRRAVCLTNEEQAAIRQTLGTLGELESTFMAMPEAKQKRIAARWKFPQAARLTAIRNAVLGERVAHRAAELAARFGGVAPDPLITGDDLILMGMKPGPVFKALLEQLYDAQLEGRVTSVAEARATAERAAAGEARS